MRLSVAQTCGISLVRVLALLILGCWVPSLLAPAAAAPQLAPPNQGWHMQGWNSEDGLPQNNVKALLQSRSGYLWIGTLSGLARFDGLHFVSFNHVDSPALADDTITALVEDKAGTLWIGNHAGIVEWQSGVMKLWTTTNAGLPARRIMQLLANPQGGLWWRQTDSVGSFQNGRARVFDLRDGLEPDTSRRIYASAGNELIVCARRTMQRWDPAANKFGARQAMPYASDTWYVLEDSQRRVWAGSEWGLFRLEDGRWQPQDSATELSGKWVAHLYEDNRQTLWAETREGGLQVLKSGRFQPLPTPVDTERNINSWLEDREGNIWVGTSDAGLIRLRPKPIKSWNRADGLPSNYVRTLCPAPDGAVWIGTELGLARLENGQVRTFNEFEPDSGVRINCLALDATGALWVSKHGMGLFRYEAQDLQRVPTPHLPDMRDVKAFHLDRGGRLWIASRRGLACYQDGKFTNRVEPEMAERDACALLADRRGDLWVCVPGVGLKHKFDGRWTTLTPREGLCDNRPIALHEDADGVIWVGTESGLNRIKDGRVSAFRTGDGLVENVVNQILEDDAGNLWLGGLRGIYCVARTAFDAVAEDRSRKINPLSYGESDGIASSETNGERQPCAGRSPDGRLWFATMGGVVEIDPRRQAETNPPPIVRIESVRTLQATENLLPEHDGASPSSVSGHDLRLPPGGGRAVTIQYTAASLTSAERLRFQYRLEPVDRDWQPAGDRRAAFYTNLRPGRYSFRVRASSQHGLWAADGSRLNFTVAPSFLERPSVQFALAAFLAGVGFGAHRWRVRFLRRIEKLEREQALETERARIAQDLHDDLGANLTGLALKADLARRQQQPEQLESHLSQLAATARALSESMREAIWLTNPRHDTLDSLANHVARQTEIAARSAGWRCRLDVPTALPELTVSSPARHQISLAVKEALHNAVKHAAATELRLSFEIQDAELHLAITDNGRGLPPEQTNGEGHGVGNIRDRARRLGGTVAWLPGPGGGTRVLFRLPTRSFNGPLPNS